MFRWPSSSQRDSGPEPDPSNYVGPSNGNRPKDMSFSQSCNSDSYYALEDSFYEIEEDEKDEFTKNFQVSFIVLSSNP